jgi:hypothetical protein
MTDKIVKPKKRSFNEIVDKANVIDNSDHNLNTDTISTSTKVEMIPLSDVKLNFKNKRVITQLIRFIPDDLAAEALTKASPAKHIIANIHKISINNIQSEFEKAGVDDVMMNYPNHSDLYNIEEEGIFVGQGICFTNIETVDKNLKSLIDDYIERVIRHGSSLAVNIDVVEKPQIVQTGGQRFKLVFGHQRYTYLVFHYGLSHVYDFSLSLSEARQDLKIFLENNNKTIETGYEQILSSYFTVLDLSLNTMEEVMTALSIGRTRYFEVLHFIEDKHLINIVKEAGICLSFTQLVKALTEVKKGLKLLQVTNKEDLYSRFEEKLLILSKKNKKPAVINPNVSLSLPNDSNLLQKILFTDVRELDGLNIVDYDLNDSKSIKKLFNKIIELISTKK